jgi:hypothetical protein
LLTLVRTVDDEEPKRKESVHEVRDVRNAFSKGKVGRCRGEDSVYDFAAQAGKPRERSLGRLPGFVALETAR